MNLIDKLESLRKLDPAYSVFGARTHRYALFPKASDQQLTEMEARLGQPLPAAYRRHLREVANGGAGPGYGLYPLDEVPTGERIELCHMGCGTFCLLGLDDGAVYFDGHDEVERIADSFDAWFAAWLDRSIAEAESNAKRRAERLDAWRSEARKHPNDADVLARLAASLRAVDEAEAIVMYERAVQAEPASAEAARKFAELLSAKGEHERAASVCEAMLPRIEKREHKCALLLQRSFAEINGSAGPAAALDTLDAAERFGAQANVLIQYRALARLELEQFEDVIALLEPLGAHPWPTNIRGICLQQLGRTGEATACFHEVIKKAGPGPLAAAAYDNLGEIARKAGRLQEALSLYEKALGHNRGDANVMLNLAAAYGCLKQIPECTRYLRAARDHGKNAAQVRKDWSKEPALAGLLELAQIKPLIED